MLPSNCFYTFVSHLFNSFFLIKYFSFYLSKKKNSFSNWIYKYIEDLTLEMICLFQADFATSAVDFLHRVGRTARAGQFGLVTSLYTESNRDLVAAVCQAGDIGQPVVILQTCNLMFKDMLCVKCYVSQDSEN
jgi:hypothetical protein